MSKNISYSPESLKHAFNFAVSSNIRPNSLGRGSFGHVERTLTNGVIKRIPFTETLRKKNGVSYVTIPYNFEEEMELTKIAGSNNNPYVVQILGSYSNNNAGYVKLEIINPKIELEEAITNTPPRVNISNVKDIIIELLKGLDSIHERKILHLDIKPANTFVFPDTRKIKYFDFGIASVVNDTPNKPGETERYYSIQSTFRGSPRYSKPYKNTGYKKNPRRIFTYNKTDDYYSLSITIEEILLAIIPEIIKKSANPVQYSLKSMNIDSLIAIIMDDASINKQDKDTIAFIHIVIKNLQALKNDEKAIDAIPRENNNNLTL